MNSRPPKPKATGLYQLAETGCLPAHQVMDVATLDWISRRRPLLASAPPYHLAPCILIPETAWFADPRLADSLHGVRHNARVSLLASILAQEYGLNPEHTAALCAAAAVHDCRRHDDRSDPGHGQRAGAWFTENVDVVLAALDRQLPPCLIEQATLAISLHDVHYEAFSPTHAAAYHQDPRLVDLLKAADAMDRYRLPLNRWWPDTSRLRVVVPDWLHPIAAELVVRSERARLEGDSHQRALLHACQIFPHGS